MSSAALRRSALILFVSVGFAASAARAQPADDLARGQELVNRAARAYGAEEYERALELLREAEGIAAAAQDPSLPSIRFNIARCLEQLGRDEEALEAYRRYDALPDASHRKQKAYDAIKGLEQRLFAVLSVSCSPAGSAVEIAGLTPGAVPCPWQSAKVRPGAYAITVTAPGHSPASQSVQVEAGAARNVQITLEPVAAPAVPAPFVQAEPEEPGRPLSPLPFIGLGAGALVAGAGGVMTALAIERRDAVESTPPGDAQDDALGDFDTFRTLSYVLYGVGGALAAAGVVFFFVPVGEEDPEAARLEPGPAGFTVRF